MQHLPCYCQWPVTKAAQPTDPCGRQHKAHMQATLVYNRRDKRFEVFDSVWRPDAAGLSNAHHAVLHNIVRFFEDLKSLTPSSGKPLDTDVRS